MASKNVRATLVTVSLGKDSPMFFVVPNKDSAQKHLFTLAVRQWNARMHGIEMPSNRKAIVDSFFGSATGNAYAYGSCTIVGTDALAAQQLSATNLVERQNKARKAVAPQEAVGRKRK